MRQIRDQGFNYHAKNAVDLLEQLLLSQQTFIDAFGIDEFGLCGTASDRLGHQISLILLAAPVPGIVEILDF